MCRCSDSETSIIRRIISWTIAAPDVEIGGLLYWSRTLFHEMRIITRITLIEWPSHLLSATDEELTEHREMLEDIIGLLRKQTAL